MKHKGARMEFHRERTEDLMRAYVEYVSSCGKVSMSDVYRKIVDMPSSRFWVSDTRAAVVMSAVLRGEPVLERMWSLRREMYTEICRRVMKLRSQRPDMTVPQLCSAVVSQPAPKFYLTPGSAKMLICKARKEWKKRKLEKLRRLSSRLFR